MLTTLSKENNAAKSEDLRSTNEDKKIINFINMKNLVLSEILQPEDDQRTLTLHNPHKITRCAATKTIKTISQDKKYKLVFDKQVIDHDTFQSFPYGYKCIFTPRI